MCGQADTGGESINLDGLQAGTYYLRVYGYAAEGYTLSITSTWSAPVTVAPSAPTNVQASTGYADHILVSWTAAANATSYQVWSSQTDDSSTATLLADNVTGSTYSDTTATGTTYYWIKAVNTVGTSDFSAAATGDLGQVTAVNETANDGYADPMDLGTLAGPTQVNGKLDTADQVDWFKFTTTAAGTVDKLCAVDLHGQRGRHEGAVLHRSVQERSGPVRHSGGGKRHHPPGQRARRNLLAPRVRRYRRRLLADRDAVTAQNQSNSLPPPARELPRGVFSISQRNLRQHLPSV